MGCGTLLGKILGPEARLWKDPQGLKPSLCRKPYCPWGTTLPALQQPHPSSGLTVSRLWSRTGSRIRPPSQAFIDRLANHTQGTQNVLCGKLSFSKCLCSAGVMKPAEQSEEAVGEGTCRRGGWPAGQAMQGPTVQAEVPAEPTGSLEFLCYPPFATNNYCIPTMCCSGLNT